MTTQSPFDFLNGEEFQIANANPAVYDGDFAITVPVNDREPDRDRHQHLHVHLAVDAHRECDATPGTVMSATHGTLYTGPITISAAAGIPATDVRAVSVVAGGQSGVVSTESYVFPATVIDQPADPAGFPTVWGENDGRHSPIAQLRDESADHAEPALRGRLGAGSALAAHGLDHDRHSQHVVRDPEPEHEPRHLHQ